MLEGGGGKEEGRGGWPEYLDLDDLVVSPLAATTMINTMTTTDGYMGMQVNGEPERKVVVGMEAEERPSVGGGIVQVWRAGRSDGRRCHDGARPPATIRNGPPRMRHTSPSPSPETLHKFSSPWASLDYQI